MAEALAAAQTVSTYLSSADPQSQRQIRPSLWGYGETVLPVPHLLPHRSLQAFLFAQLSPETLHFSSRFPMDYIIIVNNLMILWRPPVHSLSRSAVRVGVGSATPEIASRPTPFSQIACRCLRLGHCIEPRASNRWFLEPSTSLPRKVGSLTSQSKSRRRRMLFVSLASCVAACCELLTRCIC